MDQQQQQQQQGGGPLHYPATYKKKTGSLILSDTNLKFQSPALEFSIDWSFIEKHQVSSSNNKSNGNIKNLLRLLCKSDKQYIFNMMNRESLEQIRQRITVLLQLVKKKRKHADTVVDLTSTTQSSSTSTSNNNNYTNILPSPDTRSVSRAALLASEPILNEQYRDLVIENKTLTEEEFWSAHEMELVDQASKIHGVVNRGQGSNMRSNLDLADGKVRLGVEEIRQIFLLYPAVYKAYQEKVPLELSEEQFWMKYLESEYFYRDRGKIGAASMKKDGSSDNAKDESSSAVSGTEDIFSRYDMELEKEKKERESLSMKQNTDDTDNKRKALPRDLTSKRFDFAGTVMGERETLGSADLHPETSTNTSRSRRVIDKYNRHWGIVLCERKYAETDEHIANDREMKQLVDFASCDPLNADHVHGRGDDEYCDLILANTEVYSGQQRDTNGSQNADEKQKRTEHFSKYMALKIRDSTNALFAKESSGSNQYPCSLPDKVMGKQLLDRLTKHLSSSVKSDEDTLKVVSSLPENFRMQYEAYFQRSSELLRHFFGLYRIVNVLGGEHTEAENKKLLRIKKAIENLYRELEGLRKELEGQPNGEIKRGMLFSIMKQLDEAIKKLQLSSASTSSSRPPSVLSQVPPKVVN